MANVSESKGAGGAARSRRWLTLFIPLAGVVSVLLASMLLYFGYDYATTQASACDAIFRQTAVGLSTKISFLKTQGEVTIGREPLVDLSERAQITALNLKTCCTVLEVGRLDPEQFLQCKARAREYDNRLGDIVTVVERAGGAGGHSTKVSTRTLSHGGAPAQSASSAASTTVTEAQIAQKIEAARDTSRAFNKEVVAVRREHALEMLKLVAPSHVEVSAQEREPNNDGLNSNVITLDRWITAAISEGGDADTFSFKTPPTYRDWIAVELDNRSTTLEPRLELFDGEKTSLGSRYKTTPGSNLTYRFVSEPDRQYTVRASNYYGKSSGGYLLRVIAGKAYDSYEPNDAILSARDIQAGTTISAAIMDGKDVDFYRVNVPESAKKVRVRLSNKSSTLRPDLQIFDAEKSSKGRKYNTTAGSDIAGEWNRPAGQQAIYLRVSDYYADAAGAYELLVTSDP